MAKESVNKVSLSGKIVEIQSRKDVSSKGMAYLGGTVVIETGEDNFVPVGFYAQEKTNKGEENKIYKSLLTVVQDFKTINEHGREAADSVEIKDAGRLAENYFYVPDGRLIRGFQINSAFFNRKAGASAGNSFTLTGDILEIVEDVKNDVPTGTLTLRLLVIGYGDKANVIDFKVEDAAGVKYVKTVFSPGSEIKVTGNIVVAESIEEQTEAAAFGDPIVTSKRRVERKLVITSATPPINSSITEEEKNTILAVRESAIKAKEAEAKAKNGSSGVTKSANSANFSL